MDCKSCGATLHDKATFCGCGWRKFPPTAKGEIERVPCAHEDCGISAMSRIRTKTGWANLCWQHYDRHFEEQAIDNLDKYGMELQPDETLAEHVKRMREFVKAGFRVSQGRGNAV